MLLSSGQSTGKVLKRSEVATNLKDNHIWVVYSKKSEENTNPENCLGKDQGVYL